MSVITLRTSVTQIEVTGGGYNSIDLEIDGLDVDEVLQEITIDQITAFYSAADLLDAIGKEEAIDHFKIEEAEETE